VNATTDRKQFYLIRHAAPALPDNRRRFLGRTDLPLSPEGLQQAKTLAYQLRLTDLTAIYCSNLARSRQTASELARGRALVPQVKTWLCEINVGSWDLLAMDDARRLYPREFSRRDADLAGEPFPGGESLHDVQQRVIPGFLRLVEEVSGTVALVGHRAVNIALLSHLEGIRLKDAFSIPQEYCALNIIDAERGGDDSWKFAVRRVTSQPPRRPLHEAQ
jgi:alpha-ribazole phosphatase